MSKFVRNQDVREFSGFVLGVLVGSLVLGNNIERLVTKVMVWVHSVTY
jgi:hypothetical protein